MTEGRVREDAGPKCPAEEEDDKCPPWYPLSKRQPEDGICPPYKFLECQPLGGRLGTTTEGGVNTGDWPATERSEVYREPPRKGRGQGLGKTSPLSRAGVGVTRPEEGADSRTTQHPKVPTADMPRGGDKPVWGGGAKCREGYALNMGKEALVGGGRLGKEEPKMGPNPPNHQHGVHPPGSAHQLPCPPQRRRWGESPPKAATQGGPPQTPNLEFGARPPWAACQNLPLPQGKKRRKDHRMTAGPGDLPRRLH
jgi:hypothetical protein